MNWLASLDARDRRLLLWCVGAAITLASVLGVLLPSGDSGENRMPSSYLSGRHGTLAAYETLLGAGYSVERWERR